MVSCAQKTQVTRLFSSKDFTTNRVFRRENNAESNIHCFNVHFCGKLIREGHKGVAHFTSKPHKKKEGPLDIFRMKLLFLPYVHEEHYSLTVVVNPGLIGNYYNGSKGDAEVPLYVYNIFKTQNLNVDSLLLFCTHSVSCSWTL